MVPWYATDYRGPTPKKLGVGRCLLIYARGTAHCTQGLGKFRVRASALCFYRVMVVFPASSRTKIACEKQGSNHEEYQLHIQASILAAAQRTYFVEDAPSSI